MRTLVIEDEGAARRRLEAIVNAHEQLILVGSAASGVEAIKSINKLEADILLMDIQLKDMSAFEVLNAIEKDFSASLIFVTAYNHFAVKAFEVYAVDYVLKPFTEARILEAINRCLRSRKTPNPELFAILESMHFPNKICIPEGKTSHLFEPDAIDWIEADGYHCNIHTSNDGSRLIRILLKDINQLLPEHFMRISRSVIINKNAVISFKSGSQETHFKLKNGKDLFGKIDYE